MAFKNKIIAFTLVELIVWVTISILLMVSIGVFTTSWMQNVFSQQESMNNISSVNNFSIYFYDSLLNYEKWQGIYIWDNNLVFKSKRYNNKWWFTYIWKKSLENYYCTDKESYDNISTNHLYIKNFIPFIENWENISDVNTLYESNFVSIWSKKYKTLQKENKVVDEEWNIVVWRWVFWDEFEDWKDPKKIYLNSPTWLATDGEVLYISDTLNNRILYIKDNKIYKLLDETDWLIEPTGLYYDQGEKSLYISNSWKWEILNLWSDKISVPSTINFTWLSWENINQLVISFFKNWEPINLDSSIEATSFSFNSYNSNEKTVIDNKLIYNFKKEKTESWWIISEEDDYLNFIENENYSITLKNLNLFNTEWVYTYKVDLWNNSKEFYYFTQWDEILYTRNNNLLRLVHSWLSYPNWIWWKDNFNQFRISNSEFKQISPLSSESLSFLDLDFNNDIVLDIPIKSFDLSKDNSLINIIVQYYKKFNCYNLDENKSNTWTFLFKINDK